jgi:hypothetical protein
MLFSDGRTNNQGADADVSAVRASVGTAAGQGDDVPDVQIEALGQTEAVTTREEKSGRRRARTRPTALNRQLGLIESAIYL